MAIYELGEERRKTNLSALLEAAALGLKARQMGAESAYYKGAGQYYGAMGKMMDMQRQAEEDARRQAIFAKKGIPQPTGPAPQFAVPMFGQLSPEELVRQNQKNGIGTGGIVPTLLAQSNWVPAQQSQAQAPSQDPQSGMVLKSMTVDPISQSVSQTFGQAPQDEADMSVKTQLRKDVLGRMGKLQELLPLLDNFEAQLNSIPVGKGFQGKAQGMMAELKGMANTDPFAASTMSQLDALRPQIARSFGDVGNLSQTEQATAKKFMPTVSDSADTRTVKVLSGLLFLKRKLETSAKDAGLDNSPEYQEKFSSLNNRIKQSFTKALEMGVSGKRLKEFAGKDVLNSLGVKKFKNESSINKYLLSNGDIVEVGGRLAVWEE